MYQHDLHLELLTRIAAALEELVAVQCHRTQQFDEMNCSLNELVESVAEIKE